MKYFFINCNTIVVILYYCITLLWYKIILCYICVKGLLNTVMNVSTFPDLGHLQGRTIVISYLFSSTWFCSMLKAHNTMNGYTTLPVFID